MEDTNAAESHKHQQSQLRGRQLCTSAHNGQGEEDPLLSWRLGQRPLAGEQIKNLCDQGHISILEANKGREPRLVWPKKSGRESCLMHRRGWPAFVPNQLKTS